MALILRRVRVQAGRPATAPSGAGAAEYELRRAQRALDAVAKHVRQHRENMAVRPEYGFHCCGYGQARQRHLDWLEGEQVWLEARMRVLLDDGEVTP